MSCDFTTNDFAPTAGYVVGPSGEQLTEVDANNNWVHTNVYAGGKLIATYDGNVAAPTLHFHIDDPLGTRRAQVSATGALEATYQSLPFGDGLNSIPYTNAGDDDPTENHFTNKERDTESGNDYFGARYYGSMSGRFLSPDWSAKSNDPVPYAKLDAPQSLNLYSYVMNNPLNFIDPTGHHFECTHSDLSYTDKGGHTHTTPGQLHCHVTPDDDIDLRDFQPMVTMGYLTPGSSGTTGSAARSASVVVPTVGPDSQGCTKKTATDVIKGAIFYDQVDWLAGKLTDALYGSSGGYPAADSGMPSVPGSSTISAANTTASFVAGSKLAQSYVRQAIKATGGTISIRKVGTVAGDFGKYAGALGAAATAYSAYKDYQYCMGR